MDDYDGLVARRVLPVVLERLSEEPVVLLQGPRSVGKSTLLRQVQDQLGGTLIDADDPATLAMLRLDPATMIDVPRPVLIDEYQRAPEVLDAIKAVLNRHRAVPGEFLLTGSARHESLPVAAQALTGRLHRMPILPLAQSELSGNPGLLTQLFAAGEAIVTGAISTTSREDYIERIVRGGFPLALNRTESARDRWIDDYVHLTLERDVSELQSLRKAQVLPDILNRLAGQTGQILNLARVAEKTNVERQTLSSYVRLLESVFLVRLLPAWGKTLTSRSTSRPKLHVVDSGVAARLLRLNSAKLARRDPSALTELGHLVESFVVGELIKVVSWTDGAAQVNHWRTSDGDEVDAVVERDDGTIVAFEVKASARASGESFRSLEKLRNAAGSDFFLGVVLYMGDRSFHYSERTVALPIDRLWTTA